MGRIAGVRLPFQNVRFDNQKPVKESQLTKIFKGIEEKKTKSITDFTGRHWEAKLIDNPNAVRESGGIPQGKVQHI
jgi:hypothetical protein